MSLFKIPRTSQPQGPVGIDWGNPITKDLAHFTTPTVFDDVGRRPDSLDSVKMLRTQTAYGKGYQRVGDNDDQFGRTGPAYYGTKFTVLSVVVPFNATVSSGYYLIFRNDGDNTWAFTHDNSVYSKPTVRVHTQHYRNARQEFVNGVLTYSDTTTSWYPDMNSGLWICPTYASNVPYTQGAVTLVVAWTRILSAKEIASISANPWQIFQPIDINPQFDLIKPKVYVPNTYFTKRSSMMLGTSVAKVENATGVLGIKRVCSKQPQGIVEIDWNNPLTKNLSICFTPHKGANLVSGRNLPVASPVSFGYDMHGKYLSGGIYRQSDIDGISIAESTALVVCFDINPGNWNAAFGVSTGSNSDTHSIGLFSGSSNNGPFLSFNNGGGGVVANNYAPGWSVGPHVVATSKSNTAGLLNIWMDGKQELKDYVYGPGGTSTYPSLEILGDGKVKNYLTLYWNRVLSAKELSMLTKNPWQIFKPHVADIWMPSQSLLVNN